LIARAKTEVTDLGADLDQEYQPKACSHAWLKDHLAMYGVKNAILAPVYRSPDQQWLESEVD
jgi:hypothetical protein